MAICENNDGTFFPEEYIVDFKDDGCVWVDLFEFVY